MLKFLRSIYVYLLYFIIHVIMSSFLAVPIWIFYDQIIAWQFYLPSFGYLGVFLALCSFSAIKTAIVANFTFTFNQ